MLFAIAVLAVALGMPRGFATSLFYIPLILCGLSFRRPATTVLLAAIATIASQFSYSFRAPAPVLPWVGPAHQVMVVTTLWLTATLVYQHRKALQESKNMLAKIRRDEARHQLLVRGLNVGEWEWHAATGEMSWSPRYSEILGITTPDFTPHYMEFENRLHPEDKSRVIKHLESHVRQRTACDTEFRLRREDGNYAWVHATGQGFWDDQGNALRVVGSIDDISERKMAEERFQKIVEFSPYPIVVIDTAGEIVLTNRKTEALFGYRRTELFKKNVEQLIPERFRAMHPHHRDQYFVSRAVDVQENRPMGRGMKLFGLRKDGSEVPVEIGLIPIETATDSYVLCTIVDITPRLAAEAQTLQFQEDLKRQVGERTEQLAASNRELEDFASFASHDLKAPLRGIRAIAGFLEEDLEPHLTAQSRGHVAQLNLRVQRMEKLLDDLLDYARISDPDKTKSTETINGDVLMQEIIGLLAPPAHFNISLTGPFAEIQLRRMPLQQVLMNLIGNAIKHHDKAQANISVAIEDEGQNYSFTVTDDGPGISKQFHDRAFKMFQTLKPRDQVEGSGMGLAVVRKHVEAVGGTLSLESEENAGCIFRFTWPK